MKQRDLLKSRVKRLLREQKDMGQVSDAAALACSSVLQVFVMDMATEMQKQAVEAVGLTPIELKKSVSARGELCFLHDKVAAIDENDAKYHRPARRGKKRTGTTAAPKSARQKARTMTLGVTSKHTEQASGKGSIRHSGDAPSTCSSARTRTLVIDEDDHYDESDSDV